jgi:hypothetical protein
MSLYNKRGRCWGRCAFTLIFRTPGYKKQNKPWLQTYIQIFSVNICCLWVYYYAVYCGLGNTLALKYGILAIWATKCWWIFFAHRLCCLTYQYDNYYIQWLFWLQGWGYNYYGYCFSFLFIFSVIFHWVPRVLRKRGKRERERDRKRVHSNVFLHVYLWVCVCVSIL